MVSILDLHERLDKAEEPETARVTEEPSEVAPEPIAEAAEFEFVLGRRQIASLLFVATVVLMICVAISYLAGKSMSAKAPAAAPAATVVVREPDPPPIVLSQEQAPAVEAPLFSDPKNGSVYIQMGAVEKGVSVIFAEGLRKRGLAAFVAPGPNEKIFRVLIGPLPDPASYVRAKDTVDKIGLATFARRFPN
jgi:cell division septation protein DedD